MPDLIMDSFVKLENYCDQEGFKGWDPYDGLNSRLFQTLPVLKNKRLFRLIWIQAFKRSPVNLRNFTGVKKDYNPKALGLFLSGYSILYSQTGMPKYLEKIHFLTDKILELQNRNWSGSCWGYNFDWQARAFFQPKNTPTVVASVYVASALLDAFEITRDEVLLKTARSTCDFILEDLNRTVDNYGNFAFSYSPLDNSVVFNASLLGSRLLARVYGFTHESELVIPAQKSIAYCINHQKEDGSWSYGTLPFHQWIDNFHTGFNLECISDYMKYSQDYSCTIPLNKGFKYYIDSFFTPQGISKYYNNAIYPVDIHAPAQLIITLSKLNQLGNHKELAEKVLTWTIENMQSQTGYFYFQLKKHSVSKIPFMRWSQAWMFYALATYNKSNDRNPNKYL
jgi:rhamnogalacturonyl hydrolase YesR